MIGAATAVVLGRINENLVGLCLQGEPSLGKYLMQRFTDNGIDGRRLLQRGPLKTSLCLLCPLDEAQWLIKHLCLQATTCREVLVPLPA